MVARDAPSARLCTLAAQAETMLKNPQDARTWMQRAATAPAEPDWSDLDPEGEAFDYSDQDWRRLVFSYGEKGELIHPRYERGAARRAALDLPKKETASAVNDLRDLDPPRQPDDPGTGKIIDTDDLADRLDSLLDKPES
jgi:HemY protein